MSEYGFQSFPDRRSMAAFTEERDRSLNSRIVDYHQRSPMGNQTILAYLLDHFPYPNDFDAQLHYSQLTQGECLRVAAEHLRRRQPQSMGCLYWQINDIWPCASWSTIDVFGRWKASMYQMKRSFAPVLVSICEQRGAADQASAAIHCSNQHPVAQVLHLSWQVSDTDGRLWLEGEERCTIPAQTNRHLTTLTLDPLLRERRAEDLLIIARAADAEGRMLLCNTAAIVPWKHLTLCREALTHRIDVDEQGLYVALQARWPACFVRLDLREADAWWSDNHVHLAAGDEQRLYLRRGPERAVIERELIVTSLVDA